MQAFNTLTRFTIVALAVSWAVFPISASAQDSINLQVDVAQLSHTVRNGYYHITRAHTPAGIKADVLGPEPIMIEGEFGHLLPLASAIPSPPPPSFYPGDLRKLVSTAKTLGKAIFNPIYVNCPGGTCQGNPQAFLFDFAKSTFIHIDDQYTGVVGSYARGTSVNVTAKLTGVDQCGIGGTNPCLVDGTIQGLVNTVAATLGAGYGHLYEVFLPKNVDVCLTDSHGNITACDSPDVARFDALCAYHSSANQSNGHLVYTVQPFMSVGCNVAPPNVNGVLSDSTDTFLAHEIFEAISDPDVPAGFVNLFSLNLFKLENADECQAIVFNANFTAVLGQFAAPVILNGHKYKSQLNYSNKYKACASTP